MLLPLQSVWAAAGSLCQHEGGAESRHIGHHAHEHNSNEGTQSDAKKSKASLALDSDCSLCHACCSGLIGGTSAVPRITSLSQLLFGYPNLLASANSSPPYRPKWSSLA
jgi:hypothetical protein